MTEIKFSFAIYTLRRLPSHAKICPNREMNTLEKWLLEQMQKITPEEQLYLDGTTCVRKDIYTKKKSFEIDYQVLLDQGKLITVRQHARFVEFPAHKHNYVEMVYVFAGEITHYIDGKALVTKPGDLLLMNQHVMHSVKQAQAEDIAINFIILPEFFDIPLQMINKQNVIADFLAGTFRQQNLVPQYLLFQLGKQLQISNLMENIIQSIICHTEYEHVINQYSIGLVFLYLLHYIDKLSENSSQNYEDIIIQAVLKYIDTQYKTASLSHLAIDLNQSPSVISRLIKRNTGFTFKDLLMRKRFQKAVILLLDTDLSVEEIATNIGYENRSYFYRQFKAHYGVTPNQYRSDHKNDTIVKI